MFLVGVPKVNEVSGNGVEFRTEHSGIVWYGIVAEPNTPVWFGRILQPHLNLGYGLVWF